MHIEHCNCVSVSKTDVCFKKGKTLTEHPSLPIEVCKTSFFGKTNWMLHHEQHLVFRDPSLWVWLAKWVASLDYLDELELYLPAGFTNPRNRNDIFDNFELRVPMLLEDTGWRYRKKFLAEKHKWVRADPSPRITEHRQKPFLVGYFFKFSRVGVHDLALG